MKKLLAVFFMLINLPAIAGEPVGHVTFIKGEAHAVHEGQVNGELLVFDSPIFAMDTITTEKGELKILLSDDTLLSLGNNSKLLVTEYVYKPQESVRKSIFNVFIGTVRAIVSKTDNTLTTSQVTFETPTAVAGIRGTDLGISVTPQGTTFACFDGAFEASTKGVPQSGVMVTTGQFTEIKLQAPPAPATNITPQVQHNFETHFEPPSGHDTINQPGGEHLGAPPPDHPGEGRPENPPPHQNQNGDKSDQGQGDENNTANGPHDLNDNPHDPNAAGSQPGRDPHVGLGVPSGPPQFGGPNLPSGNFPQFLPPLPPRFIPGGGPQTPSDAGGSGPSAPARAPVDVPIHFPSH